MEPLYLRKRFLKTIFENRFYHWCFCPNKIYFLFAVRFSEAVFDQYENPLLKTACIKGSFLSQQKTATINKTALSFLFQVQKGVHLKM